MKRKILVALGLVVVLGTVVIGCGSETSTQAEVSKDKPVAAEQKQEEKQYKIGDTVDIKGMKLMVDDVTVSSGSDYDKPKEGNEFVIVKLTIKNDSDKNISYNPFDYSIKNSNGQITQSAFTITDSDTALSSGELAAGGEVSGTISFEAPKGDQGLKLLYKGNIFSDDVQAEISLNK